VVASPAAPSATRVGFWDCFATRYPPPTVTEAQRVAARCDSGGSVASALIVIGAGGSGGTCPARRARHGSLAMPAGRLTAIRGGARKIMHSTIARAERSETARQAVKHRSPRPTVD